MGEFSFVHTADIHLDSGFKGISGMDERVGACLRDATFSSFRTIIQYCVAQHVDFLLISGDIYNEEDRSLRAQLQFQSEMKLLHQHGIQVYLVHGNHDSLKGWSAELNFPPNVHKFDGKQVDSCLFEKDGVSVAKIDGISFFKRDIHENLSDRFPTQKSQDELFHIGLLHCNVGNNRDHESYAPCTIPDLLSHQLDYWALGHIHLGKILHEEPWIVYPGNPQGLNPKETGPKGFYHVKVHPGKRIDCQFVPSDTIRWFINEVSIRDLTTIEDLRRSLAEVLEQNRIKAENRPSLCRIVIKERGVLAPILQREDILRDLLESLREMEADEKNFVWVENLYNRTECEIDKALYRNQNSFLGDLIEQFDQIKQDQSNREKVFKELESLFHSPVGKKYLTLPEPDSEEILALISEAENFCLNQLQSPSTPTPGEEDTL